MLRWQEIPLIRGSSESPHGRPAPALAGLHSTGEIQQLKESAIGARSHFNCRRTKASVKSVLCTDQMDLKSKSCQDLNNQLAIYQAFRNTHGVAAVLRQMANEHCPIQKVVILHQRAGSNKKRGRPLSPPQTDALEAPLPR